MIDIYDSKALYGKIDALRIKKGWTVNQLAQQAGISSMALYHWRERKSSPTLALLDALYSALGIGLIGFLMDESGMEDYRDLLEVWNGLTSEQQKNMLTLMKSMK